MLNNRMAVDIYRSKVIDRNPCGLRFDPHVLVLPRCWSFQPWSFSRPIALSACRLQVLPLCGLPSLRLSQFVGLLHCLSVASSGLRLSHLWSCHFQGLPLRAPPSLRRFQLVSLPSRPLSARGLSWGLLGPLVASYLSTRGFPRVASPRPPPIASHVFSHQVVISTPCAASNNERFSIDRTKTKIDHRKIK